VIGSGLAVAALCGFLVFLSLAVDGLHRRVKALERPRKPWRARYSGEGDLPAKPNGGIENAGPARATLPPRVRPRRDRPESDVPFGGGEVGRFLRVIARMALCLQVQVVSITVRDGLPDGEAVILKHERIEP